MIQANDVMLNNLLLYNSTTHGKRLVKVNSFNTSGVNSPPAEVAKVEYTYAMLDGILIDETVLEQCGFVEKGYVNQDQDDIEWYSHPLLPDLQYRQGLFSFGGSFVELPHIKYLHQLQNFFKTLTGEELPVNIHLQTY